MNKFYKKIIIIILFSVLFQVSLHAQNITFTPKEQAWMQTHKTVKIGIDNGYAPYSFIDDNGEVRGIVKEYLDAIEQILPIHFKIVSNLSWPELMQAVKTDKIDAVATVVKLPEREKFLVFSKPYIKTPLVLITKHNTKNIKTTKDLLKLNVALVKGYSSTKQILQKYPNLHVKYVKNILEGLNDVASNRADALVAVLGVAHFLAARNGINNLKVNTAIDMKANAQRFGIRKDWPELASLLNKALDSIPQMQKDGISEKYLGLHVKTLNMLNAKQNIFVYFPWLGGVLLVVGLIYIGVIVWNYRLKKELKKHKEYFETVFEITPNIMIMTNGKKISRANKKMLEFTGYKDFESFKKEHSCICDFFVKKENYIQAQMGKQTWLEYILERPDELHQVCMKKDDKEYFFVVHARENTLAKDNSFIVVFNDVTELKELEKTLRYSKQQFDLFMENIPFVVAIKDENYKNIYTNGKEKLYIGKDANENNASFNLGEEAGKKVDLLCDLAKEKGSAENIIKLDINDKEIFARVVAFSIEQHDGKIYVGVLYIDITQTYLAQQKIKEQEKMMLTQSGHAAMGEMISMIAHQWRQPISVISMDANNIIADIELESVSNEALMKNAQNIIKQTQHLSKTIDDFRNFFKPNKQKEKVLVSDVFFDTLSIVGKSLENNNIEIQNKFDTSTQVQIYTKELLQVLLNILQNAKEALVENREKERKITNSIFEDEKYINIEICDNAGGIKDDIIDKIFDPYFSTKEEKNGTGLGLYMSKIIVKKHIKGVLQVQNKKDGACFTIRIPKVEEGREE